MRTAANLLLSLTLMAPALARADEGCRASRDEPKWVSKPPIGYKFDYSVGQGRGQGRSPTVSAAIKNAISTLLSKEKVRVTSLSTITEVSKVLTEVEDGEAHTSERAQTTVDDQVQVQAAAQVLEGLEVVETYEQDCGNGDFDVRALIRVRAKRPRPGSPPNYYATAWVPSLAQFQKEDTGKAYFILFGELALAGAGGLMFVLSNDAFNQAAAATTQSDRDFYNDRGSLQRNVALGLLVGAGGLYVYNVLDGMLAEDTLHYARDGGAGPIFAAAPIEGGALGMIGARF